MLYNLVNWEGKSIESNLARRLFPELKVYSWLNFMERSDNRRLSVQYLVNYFIAGTKVV